MGPCLAKEKVEASGGARAVDLVANNGVESPPEDETDDLTVKILLLGAGDSGKSTLFKQMRLNYIKGSKSQSSLKRERANILGGFVQAFGELIKATIETKGTLGTQALDDDLASLIPSEDGNQPPRKLDVFPEKLAKNIAEAWKCPNVQQVWNERAKHHVTDTLGFFCENLQRISADNYIPTVEDFLFCRTRTIGVKEQTFYHKTIYFHITDVGGQRNERRKWLRCLIEVTTVIYVASVSEFDQLLYEDERVGRLQEALELFKKVLGFALLEGKPIMLFLNKVDILMEKLDKMEREGVNLDQYFPTLGLGTNYRGASRKIMAFMVEQFNQQATKRTIYSTFITATDNDNFQKVFENTARAILGSVNHNLTY